MKAPNKKLVLEDGREFPGYGYGADRETVCEIVFNTSMAGYQEILSDPSYTDQIVVMTYPLIGNYGMNDEDFEARTLSIGGMVVREWCETPSNFRFTKTLSEAMEEYPQEHHQYDGPKLEEYVGDEATFLVIVADVGYLALLLHGVEVATELVKRAVFYHNVWLRAHLARVLAFPFTSL